MSHITEEFPRIRRLQGLDSWDFSVMREEPAHQARGGFLPAVLGDPEFVARLFATLGFSGYDEAVVLVMGITK